MLGVAGEGAIKGNIAVNRTSFGEEIGQFKYSRKTSTGERPTDIRTHGRGSVTLICCLLHFEWFLSLLINASVCTVHCI